MYLPIFGFHFLVLCPKWTPPSSNLRMVIIGAFSSCITICMTSPFSAGFSSAGATTFSSSFIYEPPFVLSLHHFEQHPPHSTPWSWDLDVESMMCVILFCLKECVNDTTLRCIRQIVFTI